MIDSKYIKKLDKDKEQIHPRGWIEIPYSLVKEEFQEPIYKDLKVFHLVHIKTLEILESGLNKEEYELVKDDWNKRIEDFTKKHRRKDE